MNKFKYLLRNVLLAYKGIVILVGIIYLVKEFLQLRDEYRDNSNELDN